MVPIDKDRRLPPIDKTQSAGWNLQYKRGLDGKRLFSAIRRGSHCVGTLKWERNVQIHLIEWTANGESSMFCIKHHQHTDFGRAIKPSRGRTSFMLQRRLHGAGCRIPEPIAFFDRRDLGILNRESYFISRAIPNSHNVFEDVRFGFPKIPDLLRRSLIRDLARQVAKIHRAEVYHGDLKSSNLILSAPFGQFEEYAIYLIDFEKGRTLRWLPKRVRWLYQVDDLKKLLFSVRNWVPGHERWLFLRSYLQFSEADGRQVAFFHRALHWLFLHGAAFEGKTLLRVVIEKIKSVMRQG